MMQLNDAIDLILRRAKLKIDHRQRARLSSTLKFAGFHQVEDDDEFQSVLKIVTSKVEAWTADAPLVAAPPTEAVSEKEAAKKTKGRFEEIDSLNKKGVCPKCRTQMVEAKLKDGESVNYCKACKVTLWKA